MPSSPELAVSFLETQWSSVNENKRKGIESEIALRQTLKDAGASVVPGGWILRNRGSAANPLKPVMKCIIPVSRNFSWSSGSDAIELDHLAAYLFFQQLGADAYLAVPKKVNERSFALPSKGEKGSPATRPRPYPIELIKIIGRSRTPCRSSDVFRDFSQRKGMSGTNAYPTGRINPREAPWTDLPTVRDLFWSAYTLYFFQTEFLLNASDIDSFLISDTGKAYPIELKRKRPANSKRPPWFGIDVGPFAKLSFVTANSMNADGLFIVEEVDDSDSHVEWLAIRFTDLVRVCDWVPIPGGQNMRGGGSSTIPVPKAAFSPLATILPKL